VALMMDWDDSSGSSSSEDEDDVYNPHKVVSRARSNANGDHQTPGQSSIRGLQKALEDGWVVQRARDMCSFAHDRYRQATQSEVMNLPGDAVARMSSKVRQK
jgi:hypothetical protein